MISLFSEKAQPTLSNEQFVESEINKSCLIKRQAGLPLSSHRAILLTSLMSKIANNSMHTKQELPNN